MTATVSEIRIRETQDGPQASVARVLLDLVSAEGLPLASWTVCAIKTDFLSGQIYHPAGARHDALVRGQIQQWAEVFDSEVVETKSREFTRVETVARLDGVTVELWGHVEKSVVK